MQDDDSYGEDEFDRSEGGGGGRNSPTRERGAGAGEVGGGRVPCEASGWPMSKRIKGLKTLKRLSKANRCVWFIGHDGLDTFAGVVRYAFGFE